MKELCYLNNESSLFKKYASLVTWFANTPEGWELLQLPNSKRISLLLPNGYHELLGADKKDVYARATFYSRPVYAPLLSPALLKFDLMQHSIWDFDEAKKVFLWNLGLNKKELPPALVRSVFLDTRTYNPDAHPETTTFDGVAQRDSVTETFTDIRAGAGTGAGDTLGAGGAIPRLTAYIVSGQYSFLCRGIFLFDTSTLYYFVSTLDQVNSILFSLYFDAKDNPLSQSLGVVSSNPASNTGATATDYNLANFGSTLFAPYINQNAVILNQYTDFTFNAAGKAAFLLHAINKYGFRYSGDIDNSAPTWASGADSFITPLMADNGSNKPKITVSYKFASAAAMMLF
jgi:hypothetical protein